MSQLNRRSFVRTTGGACAAAFASERPAWAQDDAEPVTRTSIDRFAEDAAQLSSLRRAIRRMRDMDPTHPFSWAFQANIHWRPQFPEFLLEQARSPFASPAMRLFREEPDFTPTPDVFNQCPHGNWWFLPWHRAYLYYFERILKWAADDERLGLPYWDYSAPDQRTLPAVFRQPAEDDGCYNPLYLPAALDTLSEGGTDESFPMRSGFFNFGLTELSGEAVHLRALDAIDFTGQVNGDSFGGARAEQLTERTASGALELVPHNLVHGAVGGDAWTIGGQSRIGFMSTTLTAARDPIFWLHHCNIDRLWETWIGLSDGRQNPTDDSWLSMKFTFFDVDENGQPKAAEITVADLLSTEDLGYHYEDTSRPEPVRILVTARAESAEPEIVATSRGPARPSDQTAPATARTRRQQEDDQPIQLGDAATEIQLRYLETNGRSQLRAADPRQQVRLALRDLRLTTPTSLYYEVYVNRPVNAPRTPDSRYFIGTVSFFGMEHVHAQSGEHAHRDDQPQAEDYRLAVPRQLASVDEPQLRVELVPTSPTQPVRQGIAAPPQRRATPVATISHIELELGQPSE